MCTLRPACPLVTQGERTIANVSPGYKVDYADSAAILEAP